VVRETRLVPALAQRAGRNGAGLISGRGGRREREDALEQSGRHTDVAAGGRAFLFFDCSPSSLLVQVSVYSSSTALARPRPTLPVHLAEAIRYLDILSHGTHSHNPWSPTVHSSSVY